METTDLHGNIHPYDYYADRPADTIGLARVASLVSSQRAQATNTLLLDNGDFLQGTPMTDYIAHERGLAPDDVHPVIAAMNSLKYDAATLGNHDFDYGLPFLMNALAGANFPVVSANVLTEKGCAPDGDVTLLRPWIILERMLADGAGERHPIRIGVIGFLPPQIAAWDREHLEGRATARDIVESATAHIPRLKQAGADIIIALSHSGIGAAEPARSLENASVPLAAIDGIDAVLTGHSHQVFPSDSFRDRTAVDPDNGTIHGKPAVMAGARGSHLGVVDLILERDGNRWKTCGHAARALPIFRRADNGAVSPLFRSRQDILNAADSAHQATLAHIRRPVGHSSAPLHSWFALVADSASVQIVADAQRWYVETALKGTRHAGLSVLSAAAPFRAGGRGGPDNYCDVPAGDIAIRNVADVYPHPNSIRAVRVSGGQLKDWLERAAGIYNRILPGARDAMLLNPDAASHNFDVIDGVTYDIDLSRPARFDPANGAPLGGGPGRIRNLCFDGRPVKPEEEFVIATNSYRAGGGGNFPGAGGSTVILERPDSNSDVLLRYIARQGTIDPSASGNWGFSPLPGTTVLFDTSPKAAWHLDDLPGLKIEPAGNGPDGFARFRLFL